MLIFVKIYREGSKVYCQFLRKNEVIDIEIRKLKDLLAIKHRFKGQSKEINDSFLEIMGKWQNKELKIERKKKRENVR